MSHLRKLEIEVNISDLLERVKANREQHRNDYEDAFIGYHEEVQEQLARKLAKIQRIRENLTVSPTCDNQHHINLTVPVSHVSEYDQLIGMLNMTKQQELVISGVEYRQWVMNQWDWSASWSHSNSGYITKTRGF